MPDDQDELVAPAPQAAPPPSPEGDEVVQAAPKQPGFFKRAWDYAVQYSIADTINKHAFMQASNRALDEWLHGRFAGSGSKANAEYEAVWNRTGAYAPRAPEVTGGAWGAIKTGFQQSATGLTLRGDLPSVTLDANGSKWWEKQLAGLTQTVSDLPEMAGGAAFGGALGIESGPGAVATGGAAAFAMPTAIREALVTAYSTNRATSVADFMNRTKVAALNVSRDATLGAITAGAGNAVKPFATPVAGSGLATQLAAKSLVPATEATTLSVAGPALQGRLPERDDFVNAAVMVGGLHLARGVADGLGNIYARTGVTPRQVLADAQTDPTIAQDLRVAAAEPEAQPTQTVKGAITSEGDAALQAPEATFQKYEADPRTAGGKIINGDLMAEVASPAVAEHPIEGHSLMAEHGAANRLANDLFEKRMAEPPASPDEAVLILVGNAGVGKSTIAERNAESYQTVLDTNNANPTGLQQSINKALNSGRKVDVLYVHAPIEEAVQRNVARQAQEGRPVRILDQADLAVQAPASFGQAHEVFGQDPNVSFSSHETVPNGQTHTGQAAADFVQGLRDQNASQNVLQKATDAYTEATRGRNVHPDARAIFEHGLPEGSVVPPESDAGGVPAGDRAAGGREDAAAHAPGQSQVVLPRAYQSLADQQAVQDAIPGTKIEPGTAEAVAQELFGFPGVAIPGEPTPTTVNFKYLNTSAQVNGALLKLSELTEAAIQEQRRGTVPWAQTEMEAGKYLSNLLGADQPLPSRDPGTAAGAAELLARKQLVRGAALDMKAQAKALVEAGTNASPDQVMEFLNSINRSAMIQAEFLGARAEAGRALNILKDTKVTAERAELIQDLISRFKQDPLKLAQMLEQTENPEGASAFARDATKATKWQMVMEAWKAGLLGPLAVTKKGLSDGVMMVSRPLVDAIAYPFSKLSSDPAERMSVVEPLARVIGNVQGASEGLTQAWNEIKLESMGGVTENRAAIPGVAGELIRTPFRMLKAVTVLAKAMQERGEANALAARLAAFEGYNPGTQEFNERVAQYSMHPPDDLIPEIEKFGERMTFNAPLNPPGKAFQKFVSTPVVGEVAPLQVVFPFTKVPLNVFDEQTRLSPLSFLSKDWRTDFMEGGASRAKASAEMVVGMGLTGLGLAWAGSGRISGAGDPDPNKRRVAMAAGWQPYSIKIGDMWYSTKNIHPVGTLLGLAADVHEMSQFMDAGESDRATRTLGQAFAHSVTEQTMLQGMTMVVEALNAPERGVENLLQGYAGSLVPATVAQVASTMDPYQREINSIRDAVYARIPGLREGLEPRRDPYGEPIPNPDRLGVTTPIIESKPSTDLVRTEAQRLGVGVAKAPQSVNLPSKGLLHGEATKVQLTPEQRDVFASVAGHMAYSIMEPLVHSPEWEHTPDLLKAKIYDVAFQKANKIGNAAALSPAQRQQEMQRVSEEIAAKLKTPQP